MTRPERIAGRGFLVFGNGDRHEAAYSLQKMSRWERVQGEEDGFIGMLRVVRYRREDIPDGSRLELADGRRLRFKFCAPSDVPGLFEVRVDQRLIP